MRIGRNYQQPWAVISSLLLVLVTPSFIVISGTAAELPLTITGQVTDALTGQPIEGVIISDQCQQTMTSTNSMGQYTFVYSPTCRSDIPPTLALTYRKPGYKFVYRPSFEHDPSETFNYYPLSQTVNVTLMPYSGVHVGQLLHYGAFRTAGATELDSYNVLPGTFQPDDILFVDVVTLDDGQDDPFFTVSLRGPGLETIDLLSGGVRAGHGGHAQFYGGFSNPAGTPTVSGPWHFSFFHSAPFPGQSTVADFQLSTSTGHADWIIGPFTIALRDDTATGPLFPPWVQWQLVRLRPISQLTALGSVKVWLGLKNSDDVGTKFDLLAEIFRDGTLVGSGQLNAVPGGSSGFNNAVARAINLGLFEPVSCLPGDMLSIRLSVRVAVNVAGHRSGTARLWFNDSAADSHFDATTGGVMGSYYLRSGSLLNLIPGPGPMNTLDVFVDRAVGGNPFKPFGTWSFMF